MIGLIFGLALIPLTVYLIDIALATLFHNLDRKEKDRLFWERLNNNAAHVCNQTSRYGRK